MWAAAPPTFCCFFCICSSSLLLHFLSFIFSPLFLQNDNDKHVNTKVFSVGCRYFWPWPEPAHEPALLAVYVLQQSTERPMAAWQTRSRGCAQSHRLLQPQTAQLLSIHPRQAAPLRGWDGAPWGSAVLTSLLPLLRLLPPSLCSSSSNHGWRSTSWNLSERFSWCQRYTPVTPCAALNAREVTWLPGF